MSDKFMCMRRTLFLFFRCPNWNLNFSNLSKNLFIKTQKYVFYQVLTFDSFVISFLRNHSLKTTIFSLFSRCFFYHVIIPFPWHTNIYSSQMHRTNVVARRSINIAHFSNVNNSIMLYTLQNYIQKINNNKKMCWNEKKKLPSISLYDKIRFTQCIRIKDSIEFSPFLESRCPFCFLKTIVCTLSPARAKRMFDSKRTSEHSFLRMNNNIRKMWETEM